MSKKEYPFIDIMRIIASLLVIGIHTYPFLQINASLDFFTTHILGRLAVPFFFVTTSFFLYQNEQPSKQKFKKVLKHLSLLYFISILIYLPLQIYNHTLPSSFFNTIKTVFIDGTFYHLWYFPAAIIGLSLIYLFFHSLTMKQSFIIVIILYIIGLGGDSYYGLVSQNPLFKEFYRYLFICCCYTRNGFFFAPLFMWLGAYCALRQNDIQKRNWVVVFLLSFLMMNVEITLLSIYNIPRHDTMSLSLPITILALFMVLTTYTGKRFTLCKDLSLCVYIIHPMIIVIVRFFGKIFHLENCLIHNNLIQFMVVTILSFVVSYLILLFKKGVHHGYKISKN